MLQWSDFKAEIQLNMIVKNSLNHVIDKLMR